MKTLVDRATIEPDRARPPKPRLPERIRTTAKVEGVRASLSSREAEVLRQLADGKTNREIGALLRISARTVETHRARLMRKLDLHSMNQLVRYAVRHRIINA